MRISGLGLALVSSTISVGQANHERLLEQVHITSCRVVVAAFEAQAGATHNTATATDYLYQCIPDEDDPMKTVSLILPDDFTTAWQAELFGGQTYVSISNATVVQSNDAMRSQVLVSNEAAINIMEHPGHRRLEPKKEGTSSVLVLRITSPDSTPTLTKDELSARVFGIGAGAPAVNLKSQFDSCSFGKLTLDPAANNSLSGIENGVADVVIGSNVSGASPLDLDDIVTAVSDAQFGNLEDNFDHVMYCLPPGAVLGGSTAWTAFGFVGYYRSVFNDDQCGYVSTQMRQIGHNIGLRNSNEGSTTFGDNTGYMGSTFATVGGPSMCYNGHKNWLLGWYDSREFELKLQNEAWEGKLAAFVDYNEAAADEYSVIKIGDLYLQYNRAKDFNMGTQEMADRVTVTHAAGDNSVSDLLAGIAAGMPGVPSSFETQDSTSNFTIEVCDQVSGSPDYALMSIYRSGQHSTCPSQAPSMFPSSSPSQYPSTSPSLFPSDLPSMMPSNKPSTHPSVTPSTEPTEYPSHVPSSVPSLLPSDTTTKLPTDSPSVIPSVAPSILPSSTPSGIPTYIPSAVPSDEPSGAPTLLPSVMPSSAPSSAPSIRPSGSSSVSPTGAPSKSPTEVPSHMPSAVPSYAPSEIPTNSPSRLPSVAPSAWPTRVPTRVPSAVPSDRPSGSPTVSPSVMPSTVPSISPTSTPSEIPSGTPSAAPSDAPSHSPSQSPSDLPSAPPSVTPSRFPSDSPSALPSAIPTDTPSALPSSGPSFVPSEAPSNAPSVSPSHRPSRVPTDSPSALPSWSPSLSPSAIPSDKPSDMGSNTPTVLSSHFPSKLTSDPPSRMPSDSPSFSPSRVPSTAPSGFLSVSPSAMPSDTPSRHPSAVPSNPPSGSPSAIPSDAPSDDPTTLPSSSPSAVPSTAPTNLPSSVPSESPSLMPSNRPSFTPSVEPSVEPSERPSYIPSGIPSPLPSADPTNMPSSPPSGVPSSNPSATPSVVPSWSPSAIPSDIPSAAPSNFPSSSPSAVPSEVTSDAPSYFPSWSPSAIPSDFPSGVPSDFPSSSPSAVPSEFPSNAPSHVPSWSPSVVPSDPPSEAPTDFPSGVPSNGPSDAPSDVLTLSPSAVPSKFPSSQPSAVPSSVPSLSHSVVPTRGPSAPPSAIPSLSPSALPSVAPSIAPSDTPSGVPTALPSVSPSVITTESPSSSPSIMPSVSPSLSPTQPPVYIDPCDDSINGTFFVDEQRGDRGCIWLNKNPEWQSSLCNPSHDAYDVCAETCGKCSDACHDTVGEEFWVNNVQRYKNCSWLAISPGFQTDLCHSEHDAYELCRETCNNCLPPSPTSSPSEIPTSPPSYSPSTFPSASPSFSPTQSPVYVDPCDDSVNGTFFVDEQRGERGCVWLNKKPEWKSSLCVADHEAYDVCAETCGKCTDSCHDVSGQEFWVNNVQRYQNCSWLAVSPGFQLELCHSEHEAYELCRETCNNCLPPGLSPSSSPTSSRFPSVAPSTSPSRFPSVSPSLAPSASPTDVPSRAPVYIDPCDDSFEDTFFVDEERGDRGCIWLSKKPEWQAFLCVPEHDAYDICPETCGKCTDSCLDTDDQDFWVNNVQRYQNCSWLAVSPGWRIELCYDGHEAYDLCRETCDNCLPPQLTPTSVPTAAPTPSPTADEGDIELIDSCDDSYDETFFVDDIRGYQDCIWLLKKPLWQPLLCDPSHDAYSICEETCGKCTDDCDDEVDVDFYVDDVRLYKTCDWLAVRPAWRAELCYDGHEAFEFCRDTCNSCD